MSDDAGAPRRRFFVEPALVVALVAASTVLAGDMRDRFSRKPVRAGDELTVAIGNVELLYPGLTRTVPVRITNPFDFAIRIIRFDVASSGTSACAADNLAVATTVTDGPMIKAGGSVDTHTTIAMLQSAPDSCQRERFHFSVKVSAVLP